MPSAPPLRTDYSPAELRQLTKKKKDNNQSRRLLSLAAVLDGMNHTDAARIESLASYQFLDVDARHTSSEVLRAMSRTPAHFAGTTRDANVTYNFTFRKCEIWYLHAYRSTQPMHYLRWLRKQRSTMSQETVPQPNVTTQIK